jgi:hypothetical protein
MTTRLLLDCALGPSLVMTEKGHFDPFPPPRLNGRCPFSQPTSAGVRGNEKDAPISALVASNSSFDPK